MSHVRLHYFLNAGNVFNTQSVRKLPFDVVVVVVHRSISSGSTQSLVSQLTNATRLSCGFGVVLNLMNVARLELNYTLPLWTQTHDRFVQFVDKRSMAFLVVVSSRVIKGFQFGVGFTFI
jgi:outer membrane protein assembly factor BamA